MSDLVDRSPSVAAVVDEFIDSLESLDVLALLSRAPTRSWTTAEVAAALAVSERVARAALERLAVTGLASVDDTRSAYRLATTDERLSNAMITILGAYASDRTELINHIALGANARRKAFADAFRRKEEGGG